MAKKTNKAQWDRFIADDAFWEGLCLDETEFTVNGETVNEIRDTLPPETEIRIVDGVICDAEDLTPIRQLESHMRRWEKAQSVRKVLVEAPVSMTDAELRSKLKEIGCKLV